VIRRLAICALVVGGSAHGNELSRTARSHAVQRTGEIQIDGILDEPAWTEAPKQSGFVQRFPTDASVPSTDTRFAVLYDDDAVYVGVWADDPHPELIRSLLTRRDIESQVDAVMVAFDSYHDRRTAYAFEVSAAGVQRDKLLFDDSKEDDTWDAVWTSDAVVTSTGWTAEYRIPLNQLRFVDTQEWGLQVVRQIGRTGEQDAWSPWPRSSHQVVSRFGTLDSIRTSRDHTRLELLPYVVSGLDRTPVEAGDPLGSQYGWRRNAGLDVKYGLGPSFTLSATLNPDFGQVEADPSKINLSSNELFFAERRPIFVEGSDLFKLPLGNTENSVEGFYSRRIGAAPSTGNAGSTTIYSAAKLTGKTIDGWSVGLLDAVTGPEVADVANGASTERADVAALTNFAVARVKRDLREGATSVGVSATAVNRRLAESSLAGSLRDQAYTGGLQLEHRWWDNAWTADIGALSSWVHGTEDAITATQKSPVHYFQRPDGDVPLDASRTSMSGIALRWNIGQLGDTQHWRYGFGGGLRTAGLELNDVGFQTTSNRAIPFISLQYRDDLPGEHILNYQVTSDVYWVQTLSPQLLEYAFETNASTELANYWKLSAYANVDRTKWNLTALRGGPALRVDPAILGSVTATTDTRRALQFSATASGGQNPTSGERDGSLTVGATLQARSNIDVFVGPKVSLRDEPMQYVGGAVDSGAEPQTHYVVGRLHAADVGMTLRVNWTFSPHLALQAYAQPYIATGRYDDLKEVDRPGALRYEDRFHRFNANELMLVDGVYRVARDAAAYQFTQPDFDFRQLRSTIVVRWEYRPGSTVFAIWSHSQTGDALDDGRLELHRDASRLFDAASEDIVMMKLNYWIGL
jgi:hypothetical protein